MEVEPNSPGTQHLQDPTHHEHPHHEHPHTHCVSDEEPDHLDDFYWLCHYQGNRATSEVVRLIMDSVTHISLDSLVEHCKYLLDNLDADSNASKAEIKRHISCHMLCPRVKLAMQIQDMCKMQKDVAKCCVVHDVESGERTVNTQAMRVYLSLGAQVTGAYKTSEEKLLFNGAVVDS
ncbi:hypothetical protein T484DRAFT_1745712 [Baffinella frigidus]|nr:hypothetical protein T484DRAFT_1745712 [Cryptophyta sp. CCMP2293]